MSSISRRERQGRGCSPCNERATNDGASRPDGPDRAERGLQRHHSAEQRARWLLTTQDRVGAPSFPLTQEFLGQMLGVRRPTVSETRAACKTAGSSATAAA
jgi:hypothetical protein